MKVMILAAGYGKRLLPLTKETPKPLLKVGNKTLIQHNIEHLIKNDFTELVINIPHLGHMIENHVKEKFSNMNIEFSNCLLYTSPSPRDREKSRMPSSA